MRRSGDVPFSARLLTAVLRLLPSQVQVASLIPVVVKLALLGFVHAGVQKVMAHCVAEMKLRIDCLCN